MKVTSVQVLHSMRSGPDKVYLTTDLPSPFPPAVSKQPMEAIFDAQKGKGVEYARDHFLATGVVEFISITDGSSGKRTKLVICSGPGCQGRRVHYEQQDTPRGPQYVEMPEDKKRGFCSLECATYAGAL
jgi:hypothetical protein